LKILQTITNKNLADEIITGKKYSEKNSTPKHTLQLFQRELSSNYRQRCFFFLSFIDKMFFYIVKK
jgi:hypothetical protein